MDHLGVILWLLRLHTLCTRFNQGLRHRQSQTAATAGNGEYSIFEIKFAESVGIAQQLLCGQLGLNVVRIVRHVVNILRAESALSAGIQPSG